MGMRELAIERLAKTWERGYYTDEQKKAMYALGLKHYSEMSDEALLDELVDDAYKEGFEKAYG